PDPLPARPAAARTRLLLEGPVLSTLLRLAAPNILNLLAIAGMITFDGLFLGRLGPDVLAGASLAFPFVMLIQHTAASGMGGAVCICMLNLLGSAVRGTGNMTLPASVIVGSVIAHIVVSPVLIFGFGPVPALGPAGAGWGLIMPFGAGSLVLLAYLRSPRALV